MDWNEYFMRLVYLASYKSKDNRTKIGTVIINNENTLLATGFNGFCRHVIDPMDEDFENHPKKYRYEKPEKYFFFEHSERNAIYQAARNGIKLKNSILYTQGVPCCDCARACIQSGVSKIIVHEQWPLNGITKLNGSQDWIKSLKYSCEMLDEANINIESFSKELNVDGYADGKIFKC